MKRSLCLFTAGISACTPFTASTDSAPGETGAEETDGTMYAPIRPHNRPVRRPLWFPEPPLDTAVPSDTGLPDDTDDTDAPEPAYDCPDTVGGAMVLVRAGSYLTGPMALTFEVDHAYCIDQNELTVAHWNACVEAGGCTGYSTWTSCQSDPPAANAPHQCFPDRETYPANYIDWERAYAYCTWAGKRLALPEEWEKAARGEDGRDYPWGDVFSCSRAHAERGTVFNACSNDGGRPDAPVPVGSYPDGASPYGLLDASGNVKEWVEYRSDPSIPPVTGEYALAMGGSYFGSAEMAYAYAYDSTLGVGITSRQHGIRCAADPIEIPAE